MCVSCGLFFFLLNGKLQKLINIPFTSNSLSKLCMEALGLWQNKYTPTQTLGLGGSVSHCGTLWLAIFFPALCFELQIPLITSWPLRHSLEPGCGRRISRWKRDNGPSATFTSVHVGSFHLKSWHFRTITVQPPLISIPLILSIMIHPSIHTYNIK